MRGLTEPPSGRKTPDGNAKISVLLNEHTSSSSADSKPDVKGKRPQPQRGDGLPTEYKLTMQNTASKNLYVFGEKVEDDPDSGEEGARKKRRAFFPFSPPSYSVTVISS
jgi:transcription initiation factor TFIIF subunit beta